MMKVKIKRVDKSLPLPEYKTKGAAAFDLYARETVTIKPKELAYIPLNVILGIPHNSFVMLANRSSTHKLGITAINGLGIGDADFCGENDEYKFIAFNFTNQEITIERGTRVAQAMVITFKRVEFEEIESLQTQDRGGIGTTGNH